jgi:hypothetical protein
MVGQKALDKIIINLYVVAVLLLALPAIAVSNEQDSESKQVFSLHSESPLIS